MVHYAGYAIHVAMLCHMATSLPKTNNEGVSQKSYITKAFQLWILCLYTGTWLHASVES